MSISFFKKKWKEKQTFSIYWFILQMFATAETEPGDQNILHVSYMDGEDPNARSITCCLPGCAVVQSWSQHMQLFSEDCSQTMGATSPMSQGTEGLGNWLSYPTPCLPESVEFWPRYSCKSVTYNLVYPTAEKAKGLCLELNFLIFFFSSCFLHAFGGLRWEHLLHKSIVYES